MLVDARGQRVQLDRGDLAAFTHLRRHEANEVTDAGSRLDYLAAVEPNALQARIDRADDLFGRVVCVLRRTARSFVFALWKQIGQLVEFAAPVAILMVERLRNAAPPDITDENRLFFRRCWPCLCIERLQRAQRRQVVAELRLCATFTQPVSGGDGVIGRLYTSSDSISRIASVSCGAISGVAFVNASCSMVCCSSSLPSRITSPCASSSIS